MAKTLIQIDLEDFENLLYNLSLVSRPGSIDFIHDTMVLLKELELYNINVSAEDYDKIKQSTESTQVTNTELTKLFEENK